MKHLIFSLAALSVVYAGPDMGLMIDYDVQDDNTAKLEEIKQPEPTPISVAPLLMSVPTPEEISNCGFSIDVMGIRNLTQDGSYLKDSPTAGLRFNKCIGNNTYIQVGYERVFSAKYKNATLVAAASKQSATLSSEPIACDDTDNVNTNDGSSDVDNGNGDNSNTDNGNGDNSGTDTSNDDTGNTDNSGTDTGNGDTDTGNNDNGDTDNGDTTPTIVTSGNPYNFEDTNLDRFYVNVVREFNNDKKLFPYVFGGIGYEHVSDEAYDIESQAFYDLGAGLKYRINDTLNLITEAKGLKKFNNNDLDIVAGLGLGVMLGSMTTQSAPTPEITTSAPMPEIKPDSKPSVIASPIPTAPIAIQHEAVSTAAIKSSVELIVLENDTTYYIQVATMFHKDLYSGESTYLKKLDNAHLNYEIKESSVKGKPVQLLLVGPYFTEADARADLVNAKSIEKGAFIKKIEG